MLCRIELQLRSKNNFLLYQDNGGQNDELECSNNNDKNSALHEVVRNEKLVVSYKNITKN